jgi:hypothetical protein
MTDDMHCAVCGADVYAQDVETYSFVRWNPETKGNELVAVYCAEHGERLGALIGPNEPQSFTPDTLPDTAVNEP